MRGIIRELAALLLGTSLSVAPLYPAAASGAEASPAGRNQQAASSATPASTGSTLELNLDTSQSELRRAIQRYEADLGSLQRTYPLQISPARRARMKQFDSQWLDWLGKQNFEGMNLEGKVDYVLFRNQLNYDLRHLEVQGKQIEEMQPLLPFAKTIFDLEEARQRLEPVDSRKAAELLALIKKQIDDTRKAVAAGLKKPEGALPAGPAGAKPAAEPLVVKKFTANRGAAAITDLRNALKAWFTFYNGYDPVFTWWVAEPYKTADKAMEDYRVFLREEVVGAKADDKTAIIGDPIGREALQLELAHEMIPYTPEELTAIAKKEMAWCDAEMLKASRELGYGDDWKKALEHVKSMTLDPGKQPELIRQLAAEAIGFVDQHDLVTVPALAREAWRMIMMTPERQLVNPFFTGGEVISISYPTDTMTEEQKLMSMRGNNVPFSHATLFHEFIPGHHLQLFMMQRYSPYRSLFRTPFWVEGWALYWEMLLWDLGFQKTPEERIGALFWRMHRCARIIFSLGFHLGQMTPQECVDFLVDRVGHERENASAEVRRSFAGDYSPLYQAAYLLGGIQFYSLHKDLVGSGKMTNRAFHDAILQGNTMPVEMVRALLTGQAPAKDFTASWKFYGSNAGQ